MPPSVILIHLGLATLEIQLFVINQIFRVISCSNSFSPFLHFHFSPSVCDKEHLGTVYGKLVYRSFRFISKIYLPWWMAASPCPQRFNYKFPSFRDNEINCSGHSKAISFPFSAPQLGLSCTVIQSTLRRLFIPSPSPHLSIFRWHTRRAHSLALLSEPLLLLRLMTLIASLRLLLLLLFLRLICIIIDPRHHCITSTWFGRLVPIPGEINARNQRIIIFPE